MCRAVAVREQSVARLRGMSSSPSTRLSSHASIDWRGRAWAQISASGAGSSSGRAAPPPSPAFWIARSTFFIAGERDRPVSYSRERRITRRVR